MDYIVPNINSPINKTLNIPGSKSITNRALLIAALAKDRSQLSGILFSDDTWTFLNALKALGVPLSISEKNNTVTIDGIDGKFPATKANIDCRDAGTAARFLLAACAITLGEFTLDGSERLRARPLSALVNILKQQGLNIISANNSLPLTLLSQSSLKGGNIFVPGDESSQFLSALLMVAPFSKSSMNLTTNDNLVSRPYINMTCKMMNDFGVNVLTTKNNWLVPTSQQYQARNYVIEPDLSTASYFFAAAALTGGIIHIPNIDRKNSLQGDIQFLSALELMGCVVENRNNVTSVKGPRKLKGIDSINMSEFSDTFMTLACLAPFADKPTTITHIGHTRFQESNRINAVSKNLRDLGIKVESGDDFIKIFPGQPKRAVINSFLDHRIAMAFSIMGLKIPGIIIKDSQCVTKTCPNFLILLESLISSNSLAK